MAFIFLLVSFKDTTSDIERVPFGPSPNSIWFPSLAVIVPIGLRLAIGLIFLFPRFFYLMNFRLVFSYYYL